MTSEELYRGAWEWVAEQIVARRELVDAEEETLCDMLLQSGRKNEPYIIGGAAGGTKMIMTLINSSLSAYFYWKYVTQR